MMETVMGQISLGKMSFEVSRQAQIVFYLWLVILAIMLVNLIIDQDNMFVLRLVVFVMYMGIAALSVYAINCYVVGQCNVLAWVGVAFTGIAMLMTVASLVGMVVMKSFVKGKPITLKKK
jgi:hypothetical protein